MRKYLLGIVAMVLSYALFSFTEIKNENKTDGKQNEFYFLWDAANSTWEQADASEVLACPGSGPNNCGQVSTDIDDQGQPSGSILATYNRP